ncbi:hypothetical protein [Desulfomonile tiedjei]|uniref:hypothetical protein n=1 Tax=Desulfomonile tiedjei TaxID=2358 RepID=UPI00030B5B78|nr:hypothetical protein [Desulfomonile tiedjei]
MTKRDSDSAAFQTNPGEEEAIGAIGNRQHALRSASTGIIGNMLVRQFSIEETQTTIFAGRV